MVDEFAQYMRKPADIFQLPKESSQQSYNDEFKQYQRAPSQNQGIRLGEVAMDAARTPVDLAKALYQGVSNASPSGIYNELEAGINQPNSRKLKNIASGFGQFGDILNQAPANIKDYFIRKGAPEDFMSFIGRPEKQNWQDFFGLGEQQPGDAAFQGAGKAIPAALLSGGSGIGASVVGGLHEAGENRNPLTPAAGIGLTNALSRGYQGLQSIRGSNLAPEVAQARQAAQETSRQNYNNFNQQTNSAGVNSAYQAPRLGRASRATTHQQRILDDVPGAYTDNFANYINNGQRFEDALQSVSDLRGYGHRIRNMTNATPEQTAAMRSAFHVADRLDRATNRAFTRSGHPELVQQLQDIRTYHANEVIPYKHNAESFNLHARDRISHEDLIKDLIGNREFMHMLSDRFGGFRNRNRAKIASKTLLGLGGAGVGGKGLYEGYKFLTGEE